MTPSDSVPANPVSTNTVPALARTDVRPAEPDMPGPRRPGMGRMITVGVAVLMAVALLVLGLVFAVRQELIDPALLNADILDSWR